MKLSLSDTLIKMWEKTLHSFLSHPTYPHLCVPPQGIGTRLMYNVIDAAIADSKVTKILLNVHSNDVMAMK